MAADTNGNSITTDYSGNVHTEGSGVDVRLSSSTGDSIQVVGTLSSPIYSLGILAMDGNIATPAQFDLSLQDSSYNYGGSNNTPSTSPSPNSGENSAPTSSGKKADIVFFIDSSISMQDEINGVRTNLATFSNSMQSSGIDVRFAVVEYRENKGVVTHKPDGTNT